MADDPSAWTCTCAAAVPLALGLHHRQQSERLLAEDAASVLRNLTGSRYEAEYEFLLESILHEARTEQRAAAGEPQSTQSSSTGATEQTARHSLLSALYGACESVASQTCLAALLCTPVQTIAGVCLQVASFDECACSARGF